MGIAKFLNHDFLKGSFFAYDSKGNEIYYETSKGFWSKREYDGNGNRIYYEDSVGVIRDNRHNRELLELEAKYKELGEKIEKLKSKQ